MSDVAAIEKICPQCGRTYGAESVFCAVDGASLRLLSGSADLVGTVIADRYLVLDKLGEGGMGRVYRARHVRLPQEVAIKVLSAKLVNDPESIARFNREAANASQISSEHVARVFDFGETGDGLVYLAMEFVPGRTLRGVLDADGPLQPHRAAALVWQIAEGLDAAHRRGIVHRDLKPENVIVYVDTDGSERLKVVDFGIAKALADGGPGGGRMTRTGLVIGTPEYMSPEQITGDEIDGRSDVYALALLACVLLTGQQPFDARTPEAAMTAKLLREPRRLAELLPSADWPASLQAVLDQGLARDPAARFPTAGEFAAAFADAVDMWLAPDEVRTGVIARPTGPGRRPYATPVRPTTAIAGGTASVARPLPPTGYSDSAAADELAQAHPAAARTEAHVRTPAGSSPAVPGDQPPPAVAGLSATGLRPSASARAHDAGAVPTPAAPAPAEPAGRPSRGLVIGGAVAGVAALAVVAVLTLKPFGGAAPAGDSAAVSNPPAVAPDTGASQPAAPGAATDPGASGGSTPSAPPATPPPAPTGALDAAEGRAALDALERRYQLQTATLPQARRMLATLSDLRPKLGTPDEEVRADLLRFKALALISGYLGDADSLQAEERARRDACDVLRGVTRRVDAQSAVADSIRVWAQAVCPRAQ